jgi:hypothetical protein
MSASVIEKDLATAKDLWNLSGGQTDGRTRSA